MDIHVFSMKIYIVMDVINDDTYSHKSVITQCHVVITLYYMTLSTGKQRSHMINENTRTIFVSYESNVVVIHINCPEWHFMSIHTLGFYIEEKNIWKMFACSQLYCISDLLF